jgi:hypothetical protein
MEHVGFTRALRGEPAMPTLAQVYEQQCEECIRSAAKTGDPKQRALMLKLAGAARCGRRAEWCTCPGAA